MSTSVPTTIEHLADLLADALEQIERRFSSATRSWDRTGPDLASDPAQVLGRVETEALVHLRTGKSEDFRALAVLRITDDLRRIIRLTEDVASRLPLPASGVDEGAIDHLRRMTDLTAAELAAGADCLRGREISQVQRVLLEESALDNWYDLLLVEVLDDLNDAQNAQEDVVALLVVARTLERIGDHARHISECTLTIARAGATPSAATA